MQSSYTPDSDWILSRSDCFQCYSNVGRLLSLQCHWDRFNGPGGGVSTKIIQWRWTLNDYAEILWIFLGTYVACYSSEMCWMLLDGQDLPAACVKRGGLSTRIQIPFSALFAHSQNLDTQCFRYAVSM